MGNPECTLGGALGLRHAIKFAMAAHKDDASASDETGSDTGMGKKGRVQDVEGSPQRNVTLHAAFLRTGNGGENGELAFRETGRV
jgi:hypothetical protein